LPGPYSRTLTEIVGPNGTRIGALVLPVPTRAAGVAAGEKKQYFTNITLSGFHLREFVAPLEGGGAIITAQDLAQTDRALSRIKFWIFLIGGSGIGFAAALAAF